MKVILSTGHGRLHLIETAKYLVEKGINVSLITGWIPSDKIPVSIIKFLGKILKQKNLLYGLNKRKIQNISSRKIHSCSFSEFFIQILFLFSRYKLIKKDDVAPLGWKVFGCQSRKNIKNAEIFHVRSGAGQGGAIIRAKKRGMKVIVDHSIAHPQEVYMQLLKANKGVDNNIFIRPDSKFWKLVIKDCIDGDVVLVNSEYVKESFVKNNFPSSKIYVAELGVRPDFIGIKKDWSISGKVKLLFTGGFGKRKGANIIIETIKSLIDRNEDFELHIIGSKMNDIDIPDWFINSPSVTFHGHIPQDELKYYLINSDIYIFPSYSEGAAQSLKEAIAAGLPVIATKQSGVTIKNRETGLLITDDSVEELYTSILELKTNKSLREYISKNAISEIKNNYTWDKYSEKLEKLYKEIRNEKEQS